MRTCEWLYNLDLCDKCELRLKYPLSSRCKSKIARFTSRTLTINPSETRHCLFPSYRPRIAQKWLARAREEARGMHNPWRRLSGAASSSRHSLRILDKEPRCKGTSISDVLTLEQVKITTSWSTMADKNRREANEKIGISNKLTTT